MNQQPLPYRYLFGPVPSRRLGRSLGVDLTPPKTCSFDCLYCQLGHTTCRSVQRSEWVPTPDVLAELDRWIEEDGVADVITLAGSGEPTLHTGFGEVLEAIREKTRIASVLLTNGSLLYLSEVRKEAAKASIVKVTFSAASEKVWRHLHRPAVELRFLDALEGLRKFRREYRGKIWLEVMAVEDVNASDGEMREIARLAATISPDRIQMNTPVRPPTESSARPLGKERLEELAGFFTPRAEVIGHYEGGGPAKNSAASGSGGDSESIGIAGSGESAGRESLTLAGCGPGSAAQTILGLVRRHPATSADISATFGLSPEEADQAVRDLLDAGQIVASESDGKTYYSAAE